MASDDLLSRFARRDPVLVAALFTGDTAAVRAITRLLRHTPLAVLLQHQAALVIALVAVPETHRQLAVTWRQQDAGATRQLFNWVEQARRRVCRDSLSATAAL
ncbi:hypothetical protein [Euzebya tangerina]|uniref:hypothetical protein n=1 Tax=Euzebya tangerina TaxID=591198 RepID=UPI000E31AD32|nr:hypothetical protein [Euzebya tangerina]